jgi:protein TonB
MTPSTHFEIPIETQVQNGPQFEPLPHVPCRPIAPFPSPAAAPKNTDVEGPFQSSMLELNRMKSGSKLLAVLVSLTVNLAILAAPVFAGLYFTDTLNLKQFETTVLVAPPPPPPPPPAPAAIAAKAPPARRVFEHAGKLLAPTAIPRKVAEIKETPLSPDGAGGLLGGVPGGVAGGSMGGVVA